MHRFVFAILATVTACETGGKGYDTAEEGCSPSAPCPAWQSEFCTAGDLATAIIPHGALVTSVIAHYATGYEPWLGWVQTSEGLTYTCPEALNGDQGTVLIYYYRTE